MTPIKFLKAFGAYQPGQVATFPNDTAARLIAARIAAPYDPAPAVAPAKRRGGIAAKTVRK